MNGSGFIAWVALLLSLIALYLSWTTYNQVSDEKLGDMIQTRATQTYLELEDRIIKKNDASAGAATSTATTTPEAAVEAE